MPVSVEPTPNPNAMKFSVGAPVGGPVTYVSAADSEQDFVKAVFAVGGIQQVFMTADFVSVTKQADKEWDDILDPVRTAIEAAFS